jgi:hypothetical protein
MYIDDQPTKEIVIYCFGVVARRDHYLCGAVAQRERRGNVVKRLKTLKSI